MNAGRRPRSAAKPSSTISIACTSRAEEREAKLAAGVPYVIRFNMPTEGTAGFDDLLYGRLDVDCSTLDDIILIKADGLPDLQLCQRGGRHLMAITLVTRGTEYLSSTPKYNLIYEALGWEPPKYLHLPTVMADATRKLSKRYGDPSFEDLLDMGYLRDAIINFIALLGWEPAQRARALHHGRAGGNFRCGGPEQVALTVRYAKAHLVQRGIHAQAAL